MPSSSKQNSMNSRPYLLPEVANIDSAARRDVERDYERFAISGPPANLTAYIFETYGVDLTADYGGIEIVNPWGKASGQLSMTARQVAEDVEAELAFVVLKTVIAEDADGSRAMEAWAIRESRMVAERIVGESGDSGWTISWKGRGWWHSFDDYLALIRESQQIGSGSGTLIVPSCKYHLPTPDEDHWKIEEYCDTTPRLIEAWREHADDPASPMPLEKDFSPTLAGSDRSAQQHKVLEWLERVPQLIHEAAAPTDTPGAEKPVRLGLKMFNALFDDDFQLEMLRAIHRPQQHAPEFFIYGNRLFDPQREFDGHRGIAYGGPDLSDRNLRVMSRFQDEATTSDTSLLRWSATGNIATGKMALEYALRGASSFQLHTFFQLPADEFRMKVGSKIQKAMHELYFHPTTGFIVWLHHLACALNLSSAPLRFLDIVGQGVRLQ